MRRALHASPAAPAPDSTPPVEQPVGNDPRQRHHVRFWRCGQNDASGRPLWIGAATFDRRVGLSETTRQITHHIAADVDAERDHLFDDLKQTGSLPEKYVDVL